MKVKELIEQIEGEADVVFELKKGVVEYATISFAHFRGMESLLEGKDMLDALVFTPRVCGICGHSHLFATVLALEDACKNAGVDLTLTQKAKNLREFTLTMEIIQNHLKWLYFTIFPELEKLLPSLKAPAPLKGAFGANLATKAISVFAGQWPHSAYMVPGGVTADPTQVDIFKAKGYIQELISFVQKELLGVGIESFLAFESCKDFNSLESDLGLLEKGLVDLKMYEKGFAHDRFLVLGSHSFASPKKLKQTRISSADSRFVATTKAFTSSQKSYALNAHYKEEYYECGSLSRLMATSYPMVKNMHRRFKDSAYTRVISRVLELALLLQNAGKLLDNINVTEASCILPKNISNLSAEGVAVVEAPRGPLLHKVVIKDAKIESYKIITPTQFNIGSDIKERLTPVQKAMQGVSKEEALFIFRTFDVCSVCTTH